MSMDKTTLPAPYAGLLADIKQRIRQAQTRAVLAVNAELIRLYWEIGQMLDARQESEGGGAAVIPRLARDIRNELPEVKGFSERNIKRMLAFYCEYRALEFVPQPVAQMAGKVTESSFSPQRPKHSKAGSRAGNRCCRYIPRVSEKMSMRTALTCNGNAELLVLNCRADEQRIEACHEDETIWPTQKLVALK